MRALPPLLAAALAASAAGCGSPADVSGTYTINVTNRANGCDFDNWTEDATAQGITAVITQDDESVAIQVTGLTGGFLTLWLGGNTFTGTVDGDHVRARLIGENGQTAGNCAYTFDAAIDAHARSGGDVLEGTIRYEAKTNGNPDCGALTGCASIQAFNGSRPPR